MENICKPEIANRDPLLLCPWFAEKLTAAIQECVDDGYPIRMFEGFRAPIRQNWLFAQGRTRPGKIVTNARAWQSWHGYAVAADLAFWDGRKWSWDGPWDKVHAIFHENGFETLDFEKSHVQITRGISHQEAYKIVKDKGMNALWDLIYRRLQKD